MERRALYYQLLQADQKIEDVDAPQKVWTLKDNVFKAHKVETGTSNGTLTEIVSGISEGDEVLVDFTLNNNGNEEQDAKAKNPFMPRPRNNRNNQQKKQ